MTTSTVFSILLTKLQHNNLFKISIRFCSGFHHTWPGGCVDIIKMPSYQYRDHHDKDNSVVRSSYLNNGDTSTWKDYLYINSLRLRDIQCGAVITRINFVKNPHKRHTHSSPVRARYGMYFVDSHSDLHYASGTAAIMSDVGNIMSYWVAL